MTMLINNTVLCRALVAAVALAIAGTAAAQNYETMGELKAGELAPAALLKGPFHTVDEKVMFAGAQPNFTDPLEVRHVGSARTRDARRPRFRTAGIRAARKSQQVG